MPIPYSDNMLENPNAETGDLTGWNASNAEVVDGGYEGDFSFKIGEYGYILQDKDIHGQPPDLKIGGKFLPGEDRSEIENIEAEVEVIITYGDGTKNQAIIPVKTYLGDEGV